MKWFNKKKKEYQHCIQLYHGIPHVPDIRKYTDDGWELVTVVQDVTPGYYNAYYRRLK